MTRAIQMILSWDYTVYLPLYGILNTNSIIQMQSRLQAPYVASSCQQPHYCLGILLLASASSTVQWKWHCLAPLHIWFTPNIWTGAELKPKDINTKYSNCIDNSPVHFVQSLESLHLQHSKPSSIYSWFLKPLYVLHSRFPTKKSWVVAYFWQKKNSSQIKKKKNYFFLKQLFSADAKM